MIVVLGRPRVRRLEPDGALTPGGLAAEVALALGRAGAHVELVGSIGDDAEGDRVVVELGRAGVGHAALLRDPSARTPPVWPFDAGLALPRLDAADVDLGLRYLAECRVLVLAETLGPDAVAKALEAAAYHGAAVVMVAPAGSVEAETLGDDVTLLERPAEVDAAGGDDEATAVDDAAFAGLIADYASRLDRGDGAADAFAAALGETAWEPSPD